MARDDRQTSEIVMPGDDGREIELKFVCEPSDIAAVLAAAPAGEDETRQLVSIYFDTPAGTLRKAGASLRIRQNGEKRVQTLKRGAGFARLEDEAAIAGDVPDLTRPHIDGLLGRRDRRALGPAFTVRLERRQRLMSYQGATIELAVDLGQVEAGEAATPLCEVELELKSGEPAALFALARELAHAAPLYLSFEGKAARGQALVEGSTHTARRSGQVAVRPALTAAEAFQAIARDALTQIAANAALLRDAASAEAIHQIRVAARRLRSAMSTFKPIVADAALTELRGELKWLASACGEARALDVLVSETLAAAWAADPEAYGLAELGAALEQARSRARAKAAAAVASARFRALVLETGAWIELGDWRGAAGAAGQAPVRAFAERALSRRWRRLVKAGRDLKALDDAARHQVRIEAKKLRYAAESFASLYDVDRARAFIKALKRLQDRLGALNDAAVVEGVLRGVEMEGPALFAAGRLAGRAASDKAPQLKAAAKAMDELTAMSPFWLDE